MRVENRKGYTPVSKWVQVILSGLERAGVDPGHLPGATVHFPTHVRWTAGPIHHPCASRWRDGASSSITAPMPSEIVGALSLVISASSLRIVT